MATIVSRSSAKASRASFKASCRWSTREGQVAYGLNMLRAVFLAGLGSILVHSGAQACRLPIAGPAQIMSRDFVTVATARVVAVRSASKEHPNRAFTADLELLRTLEGTPQTGHVVLRHREATECPRVLPLPRKGDVWAVYLAWEARPGGPVTYAFPIDWAEALDRRLGGTPRAQLREH